jgi:hypothetical protein
VNYSFISKPNNNNWEIFLNASKIMANREAYRIQVMIQQQHSDSKIIDRISHIHSSPVILYRRKAQFHCF